MKRLLAILMMALMLVPLAVAQAPTVPTTVAIKLTATLPISGIGLDVEIQNLRTGVKRTYTTWESTASNYGEISAGGDDFSIYSDAGKLIASSSETDTYRFVVVACKENPLCTVEKAMNNYLVFVTVNLDGLYSTTTSTTTTTTTTTMQVIDITPRCYFRETVTPSNVTVVSQKFDENCDISVVVMPVQDVPQDVLVQIIMSVIVSLTIGAGIGIKITKYGNKYHTHPGIRGYHDPNIVHSDLKIRHKKGEMFPKYKDGKYGG